MASRSSAPMFPFSIFLLCFAITPSEGREVSGLLRPTHTYCIAYVGASRIDLQHDLDTTCGQVDCGVIRPGGPCYNPNTLVNHASVALNLYYKAHQKKASSCTAFRGALLTISDPSYGSCNYN